MNYADSNEHSEQRSVGGLRELEAHCDAFEAAWHRGEQPRIEQYLNCVHESRQPVLLRDLLEIELDYKKERGIIPRAVDYAKRFPAHLKVLESFFNEAATITTPNDAKDAPTKPNVNASDDSSQSIASQNIKFADLLGPAQSEDELGRLGDYRVLEILGHGGMGVVFLGEDPKLGRKIAIKAMLPELAKSEKDRQRFVREACTAATLEHDHIVPIFHVDDHQGAPYIVMPLLKGECLDDYLKRDKPLPVTEILRIGREIAEGLSAAHTLGLVHRDIKPANIWLETPKNRVKILDFGLARLASENTSLTHQGEIVGTPAYMAPEQARGEHVDARCDLWSLGVVLYRMCTCQLPFQGRDALSMMVAVTTDVPVAPNQLNGDVPQSLSDLVMKLLEKELTRRYASAAEVVQELQEMEDGSEQRMLAAGSGLPVASNAEKNTVTFRRTEETTESPSFHANSRWIRRVIAIFACAAIVGVLAIGGIHFGQSNKGIIRIASNDSAIKASFDNGTPIFAGLEPIDIQLTPGKFGLHIERGEVKLDTDKFILKQGETIKVAIKWFEAERKLQVLEGDNIIGEKKLPREHIATIVPAPTIPTLFDDEEARKMQREWAERLNVSVEEKNKVGIVMVLIPPSSNESKPYRMGKYEVTQEQWRQVMGYNPSEFGPKNLLVAAMDTSNFPVEHVGWFDCVEFCNKLSEEEGLEPYYELTVKKRLGREIDQAEVKILGGKGYHIPTDAEWQHACRPGTNTKFHFGDRHEDLWEYGWFQDNSDNRTHPVGEKKPNAFGLFDMHGNVREPNEEMLINPSLKVPDRVARGGSWCVSAEACAVYWRQRHILSNHSGHGLRPARFP